jgi:phage terminase large subunit
MTTLKIKLPPKLVGVFEGEARYRGAYGGRGSAKTRSFAYMAAVIGALAAEAGEEGIVLCCRQYMNSLDESSLAEVKGAISSDAWLQERYEVGEKYVRTVSDLPGRVDFKFAGLDRNLDSLKSKARIILCWVDEAENVIDQAWVKLIPTVREDNSEIWVTWNPESTRSATHKRFRVNPPRRSKIVEMNWRDNPWFPAVLEEERQNDLQDRPEQYPHIWDGDFRLIYEGAYYAPALLKAKQDGRIKPLHVDPSLTVRTWHDLAGAGDKADAYSIIVGQFVDQQIWLHGSYSTEGQQSSFHVQWLRKWCSDRGVKRCVVVLPHDGDAVKIDFNWRKIWNDASEPDGVEFIVEVIPNQGRGAAMKRIEAGRKVFPRIWFDDVGTVGLQESLTAYHEKRDDNRSVGLGPNHDWASHDADAFGLMACVYVPPGADASKSELVSALYGKSGRRGSYLSS